MTFVGGLYASRSTWYRRDTISGSGGAFISVLEKDGTLTTNGSIQLGSDEDSPTAITFENVNDHQMRVPITNKSGATMLKGTVITSSTTAGTQAGWGSQVATLATTTVLGVAAENISNGSVGYMAVNGYALVLTTGTVVPGNILVSTAGTESAGAAGYAGVTTGTEVVGTNIGTAISSGTAAGGLTIIKLR
jgi:hypothetical protein